MQRVAFIGLGVMGYPMAGHLARGGCELRVYNRTADKARGWVEAHGGQCFPSPAEAARGAEVVFTCVGDDNDLREVVLGEGGALATMAAGTYLVDHTTASAEVARELSECCSQQGVQFLDAPVSGGQQGAEQGRLTIMVGGAPDAYGAIAPLLDHYARMHQLLGAVGSGQLCKMVNQICIAGLVQALSEGLHFAVNAGLDAAQVIEVISKGAAQSWQMENRYQTMLAGQYQHGFAVDWMRKDLAIALKEARENGSVLPLTALVDQFYAEVQAMGGGRWDTSSLLARLEGLSS